MDDVFVISAYAGCSVMNKQVISKQISASYIDDHVLYLNILNEKGENVRRQR